MSLYIFLAYDSPGMFPSIGKGIYRVVRGIFGIVAASQNEHAKSLATYLSSVDELKISAITESISSFDTSSTEFWLIVVCILPDSSS